MIESYVSVQRFCFKSLYVSTMCLIADMETIPQMKSAGTPEKSRLPALLGAGDERIEYQKIFYILLVIPYYNAFLALSGVVELCSIVFWCVLSKKEWRKRTSSVKYISLSFFYYQKVTEFKFFDIIIYANQ